MWALSTSSVGGRVTEVAGDVGVARLGGERSACREGLPARLVEPEKPQGELGGEGEDAAVGDLEVFARGLATAPSSPKTSALTEKGSQLVGLRVKLGRLRSIADRAQPQRDAFEDLGQGVGDGGDLGGFGVDVERGPDDDVAEVIGARDRRGDHREAERGALVGAGEVDLAGEVDGVGAGAGAGLGGADLARRGAAGVGLLLQARVAGLAAAARAASEQ